MRTIKANLALIQTAVVLFKEKLMTISRIKECRIIFEELCKKFDCTGLQIQSEPQINFLLNRMRFNNMTLSKQFIFDWVLKCHPFLWSTQWLVPKDEDLVA